MSYRMVAARALRLVSIVLVAPIALSACEEGSYDAVLAGASVVRIYRNPYAGVDWQNDRRLKAQHHDHVARVPDRILAYDAAGYQVLSLMDYSGKPWVPWSLRERPWPPERAVPTTMLAALSSIELFIPNAEEIGMESHATSPFLETYIEGVPPDAAATETTSVLTQLPDGQQSPPKYRNWSEFFDVVRSLGGVPCIAHPFNYPYSDREGFFCVEIYTAYAEAARIDMPNTWLASRDGNALLLANWDATLETNQRALGIAVNDHFGPGLPASRIPAQVLDSGKIIVLAKAATLEAYRDAFESGAVLAVRDQGSIKDRYPTVYRITVSDMHAFIEATGNVTWTTRGKVISAGPALHYGDIPPDATYVRAEISGEDGSVIYTQAFAVRPMLDADGDRDVDDTDTAICRDVALGIDDEPLRVEACLAAERAGMSR